MEQDKQRLLELGADEMWTDFHDKINDLLIEEKKARHENDHNKLAEICIKIVSISLTFNWQSLVANYIWCQWIQESQIDAFVALQTTWIGKESYCWYGKALYGRVVEQNANTWREIQSPLNIERGLRR